MKVDILVDDLSCIVTGVGVLALQCKPTPVYGMSFWKSGTSFTYQAGLDFVDKGLLAAYWLLPTSMAQNFLDR